VPGIIVKSSTNSSPIIDSRPFSYDAETGIKTTFHYHEDGGISFEKTQDVESLLELNKATLNASPEGWKGDLHKVASIPIHVYQQLRAEGILKDPERMKRWLADPDNSKFRTKSGRL
jgi:hypothetical protein